MPLSLIIGDYVGTFVFAVTGALAAAQRRLDIFGFILLAFVTAVGGGTLRDVLLARGPVFWIKQPEYFLIAAVAAIGTFFIANRLRSIERTIAWADAVGLAVFAVIGAGIAIEQKVSPLVAILMGVLTATGGGVLRDVLRNQLPLILHREVYATAALAGAAAMVGLLHAPVSPVVAVVAGLVIGFGVRAAALVWNLNLPTFGAARGKS